MSYWTDDEGTRSQGGTEIVKFPANGPKSELRIEPEIRVEICYQKPENPDAVRLTLREALVEADTLLWTAFASKEGKNKCA